MGNPFNKHALSEPFTLRQAQGERWIKGLGANGQTDRGERVEPGVPASPFLRVLLYSSLFQCSIIPAVYFFNQGGILMEPIEAA